MQFTQYWSVWLLTLVPRQRLLGNPRRVWSRDVLIGLVCGSLLKAARHSLVFPQKIRNPIIYDILIRLVFTLGKPQLWACFLGPAEKPKALWLGSCIDHGMGVIFFVVSSGGREGVRGCFITCLSDHFLRNGSAGPKSGKVDQKILWKIPFRTYHKMFSFPYFQ